MRKLIVAIFAIVLIGTLAALIHYSRSKNIEKPRIEKKNVACEINDFNLAVSLFKENKFDQAISIIKQYETPSMIHTESGKKWLSLLIDTYAKTGDSGRLKITYEHIPDLFEGHELASILVANKLLDEEKIEETCALREKWKDKETLINRWLVLDADLLMMQGKTEQAKALLFTKEFEGKEDTDRLIKVAMLVMREDLKKGLEYLVKAQKKDSDNIAIYILRAKIFERLGQKDLANFELVLASQIAPHNLNVRDELAEFYRRHGDMYTALSIWQNALPPPSTDTIWKKFLFWSRVAQKIDSLYDGLELPEGKTSPLLNYMRTLPGNKFWDSYEFEKLPLAKEYLNREQETFWLRILQYVKNGEEKEAMMLLQSNPFRRLYWDPILEKALTKVLTFRQTKNFPSDALVETFATESQEHEKSLNAFLFSRHPLYSLINKACKELVVSANQSKLPQELEMLLKDDNAYSALFLAAGWKRAAFLLYKDSPTLPSMPSWYKEGMIEAIADEKGPQAALAFLQKLPETEELNFISAQLLSSMGENEKASQKLKVLSHNSSPTAFKASYLLALASVEQNDVGTAKSILSQKNDLAQDVLGQELYARIALLEGDQELAFKIYNSIAANSLEAQSYLAQKAFEEKDFSLAKKITEEMLKKHPTNPAIQENFLHMRELVGHEEEVSSP